MHEEDQLYPTAVLPLKRFLNACLVFLFKSIMQVGWSYIKDTEDFLKKIKRLGKIPEGTVLVKGDAVGLYPNILHGFDLQYLKKRINETGIFKLPTTKSEYKINHNFNCNSKCLISC